ncbi:hypothetical protein B0H16DRAFT_1524868, partial [Mycena metata]
PIPRGHPDLLPFDLHQRIPHASIFYASSSRRNKFMQCLLTAYIDRLRPRPPPHQAAPFCLSSNAARPTHSAQVILVLAKRKTAAKQRLCAPSRSHRRANAHPYTAIRRVASTTRARPRSSPPEARNQGSVFHPPRVNAPLRTNRAKPAACYQTVMQQWKINSKETHPNSHRPHVLPPSSSESDVMSPMSSLGAASDSSLTQTQFNPSPNLESGPRRGQPSCVLLLSYP